MVYNDIHLSNTWFKSVIRVYAVFIVFASLGLCPWDVNTIKTSIHPSNQHLKPTKRIYSVTGLTSSMVEENFDVEMLGWEQPESSSTPNFDTSSSSKQTARTSQFSREETSKTNHPTTEYYYYPGKVKQR